MASRHQVTCISKCDRFNPYERIQAIGGANSDGSSWRLSQEVAIREIELGRRSFFVRVRGEVVDVIVAISRFGNKYLKTVADGDEPNNLLSLYECA